LALAILAALLEPGIPYRPADIAELLRHLDLPRHERETVLPAHQHGFHSERSMRTESNA
jgi:hypothetical protein